MAYFYGTYDNDSLTGSALNDYFDAGAGSDTLTGGAGSDTFVMQYVDLYPSNTTSTINIDTITDFAAGDSGDQINLSLSYSSFNNTGNPFADGYARLTQSGADTLIEVNYGARTGTTNFKTIAILKNVNKTDLTAFNFRGTDPIPIVGTTGNDSLTGTSTANLISGGDGNDTVKGLDGNDSLYGQLGNDSLDGGNGNDSLFGGDGNDKFVGGAGDDYLNSGAGSDTLTGSTGRDTFVLPDIYIYAGSTTTPVVGMDIITDFVVGDSGDQISMSIYYTGNTSTNITGNPFADGYARLTQAGADTRIEVDYDGAAGAGGFQTIAILRNVNKTDLTAFNFYGKEPNPILGTSGDDSLTGTSAANVMAGSTGNDSINGLDGNDRLYGQDGNDSLDGGVGNDTLSGGAGTDSLTGGEGHDYLVAGDNNDKLFGGNGNDSLYGEYGNDNLDGGLGNDTLYGGPGTDTLTGGDGNDYLHGGNEYFPGDYGNDRLIGGAGNDTLYGDAGNDTLTGGTGRDTFVMPIIPFSTGPSDFDTDTITDFAVGDSGDQLTLPSLSSGEIHNPFADGYARLTQSGANTLVEIDRDGAQGAGGFQTIAILKNVNKADLTAFNFNGHEPNPIVGTTGNDSLTGTSAANLMTGNTGDDTVRGLDGRDTLYGQDGNDSLDGGTGNDLLSGNYGTDILIGGDGNDYLYGDSGNDTLTGGAGIDTFVMPYVSGTPGTIPVINTDTITDFAAGDSGDQIDLSLYYSGSSHTDNPFADGYARLTQSGADTLVEIDYDGAAGAGVFQTIAILKNVNKADLTAFNFRGDEPNAIAGTIGNDSLTGSAAADLMAGGLGNDTLKGLEGNDSLYGQGGNDSLDGGTGNDTLYGGLGTDILTGGEGNDILLGEDGNDKLNGGAGDDTLTGSAGNDTLTGGTGQDTFVLPSLPIGTGGSPIAGTDIITDFVAGDSGDRIDLPFAYSSGTIGLTSINNLFADGFARLTQSGADTLIEMDYDGAAGAATFQTVAILRNVNKTELTAFNFFGYEPNPILGSSGNDSLAGTNADDYMVGGSGNDTLRGLDAYDQLFGQDGNDSLDGGAGSDVLDGGLGIDSLTGGDGNDYLYGDDGNDKLSGGAGDDYLEGGAGIDSLTGGTGRDTFVLPTIYAVPGAINTPAANVMDIITDFATGNSGDRIKLSINYALNPANVTGNPFADGVARLTQSGTDTLIEVDYDGAAGVGTFQTVAILRNVNKADLTGLNFQSIYLQGIDPGAIAGTTGDDSLTGTTAANLLAGAAGNDTIKGLDGNDYLYGNEGNDSLDGGVGNDYLLGQDGNDKLVGGAGDDSLDGAAGNDVLIGGSGIDTFVLPFVSSASAVTPVAGTDIITDFAVGNSGDQINLTYGYPLIGNNTNNPFADGYARLTQSGADTWIEVDYDGASGAGAFQTVAILRNVNKADLTAFNFQGIEPNPVTGTGSNDTIAGTSAADFLASGNGNDILTGLDGNDALYGQDGNDSLTGGTGDDRLNGGLGQDSMAGGDGSDIYAVDNAGDVVTETNATATGGIDQVNSSLSAYTLGANIENGRIISTTSLTNASLTGNELSNILFSSFGNDVLHGGLGTEADTVSYEYASGAVYVSLARTGSQTTTGSGRDTLINIENLTGSRYNDRLTGNDGANVLAGGNGDDTLAGGGGKDVITGGAGSDVFDFNQITDTGSISANWDVITDFVRGQDRLDLSGLDANTTTVTDDAFTKFIGSTSSFTAAGQLKISGNILYGNTDADADAEFAIELTGIATLDMSDFLA